MSEAVREWLTGEDLGEDIPIWLPTERAGEDIPLWIPEDVRAPGASHVPSEAVRYHRRSFVAMPLEDQVTTFVALTMLGVDNEINPTIRRAWGRFADLHQDVASQIHGTLGRGADWPGLSGDPPNPPPSSHAKHGPLMMFLPWHRMFVLWFEQELRRLFPAVHVPYWDWTTPAGRSIPSIIAGYRPVISTPGGRTIRVSRVRTGPSGSSGGTFDFDNLPSGGDVDALMSIPDYETLSVRLEMVHNRPHAWIDGTMGDPNVAPADPIFFLHHAMIDRIWRRWQQAHPSARHPTAAAALPYGGLSPISVAGRTLRTVADVLSVEDLEYDYA